MKSVRIHQGYLYHQRSCCSLSSMAMDLRSTPRHWKTKASSSTLDRSTGVDMGGWCCVSLGFVVVEIDELSCESVELHSTRVISCFLPCFISELPGRCSRVFCFNVSLVTAPRNIMKSLDKKTRGTPPWRDPIFQWNTILGRDTQYKNHLHAPKRMKSRCLTTDELLWGIWPGSFVASFKSSLWPDHRITDVFFGPFPYAALVINVTQDQFSCGVTMSALKRGR